MKKGKTRNRVLAWILTMAMVLTMTPVTALAEEIPQPAGCAHIHDENCGYVEVVAEVPCDKECTDTDGDGVIDHVEDCAYTPAVEGQPCNHVHDENCGGLTGNQPEETESEETESKQTVPGQTEPELSGELTALEALFMVMNEDIQLYDTTNPVTILNSGYPYGKNMTSSSITLVIEADGTAASYQWQTSDSKDGTFEDINGAVQSTYSFTPVTGKWYRCMVNGTASEAVMAVYPGQDGRTWTKPYSSWYLSNGTMAYMANSDKFDAVGLYTKNDVEYMLCTSYGRCWQMFSSSSSTPSSGTSTFAVLDALRVSFSESDDYALIFEADLAEGQQAFSFGCDTQLGNNYTSGSYSDRAALMATVKNGALQQVAMIGAGKVADAADTDPAFVIAPVDPASRFWIGNFSSRKTYAYNTSGGTAYETIDGQNVVTLLEGTDSGMTMSWMNIASGSSVRFQFSVGDVAHTGAIGGKVDYEKDALTELEAGTTYVITAGESTYTITANANGEIPLSGTDDAGNAYDFAGKSLNIAKRGSEDTPAEVEVVGRPDTPENPSDLEEEESGTSTPTVDESIEIVELTPNSATISPKEGQQYAYSTDGTNWTILTNTESNGTYVINGLTEGATIYIRTRIPATSSTPASQWSGSTQITLKETVDASANSWSGSYDGNVHQITVNVTSPLENASIEYSSTADGNYNVENPSFKDAGVHTVYYRVMAEGYYPTSGSATVTISQREVELEWSNTSLIYNGMEQKPTVNVKADSLCGNDTCTVILGDGKTDSNAKAGIASYSITATGLSNSNYKLPSTETQLTQSYTIAQKEVGIDWSNTTFTYDRASHKPTASLNGVVTNDTCNVTVTGEQTNAGTDYTATASIDNANYKIKTSDVTTTFVINPKEITEDMISLNDTDNIYDFTNSAITPVVTAKDGEVVLTGGETGDYVLSGDLTGTAYGSYEITVTGKGNYIGTPKVVWSITETNAPKGEIILKENKWNSFLNTITFGLFFKSTQQVTVNATDGVNESGVDKVYYCVSDTLLTDSASLDSATWTQISNGGSFNINPNAKVYVYVKITDKAGNAAYISSKGIVVYTDAAQDTKQITFTKTSAEDVTATVTLNGNTISKVVNGTSELTNGTHYTISEDGTTLTFKASYLQTLSAGDYTINVSYNPMGETYVDAEGNDQPVDTSITLSVKRVSSDNADTKITNKDKLSKEYDGQQTEAAAPSSKNGSTPKVEYKKKGDPDSSFTEEVPKDAGDYVVRVTYPQDENYEETSVTEEFTISPKAVTAVVSVSTKTYNETTDAEVTATVDTGITGQKLTITGLTGTFDNKNAGTGKTVTINSTNAQVTAGAGTNAANYSITYPAESTGSIQAASLTIKVNNASKHIGKADPEFGYSITDGTVATGDTITGITLERAAGETAGIYDITATETAGSNPNYNIAFTGGKLTIVGHTVVTHPAVEATCTKTGLTEGSYCSVCGKVLVAQEVVPALGHDWSGKWKVTKEATAAGDGKEVTTCTRGCGQKKVKVIPATGTTDEGALQKDVEVAPEVPVEEATLDNKKSELLNAPDILTPNEKTAIQGGLDARVWLEINKTDESNILEKDKAELTKSAEEIMGENSTITYFDADLFKQVGDNEKTQLHEPGIAIKVTIKVPEDLLNHDRTIAREYKIIRLHTDLETGESQVDVLSGEFDEATGNFSFETDKFSTYAIAYSDTKLVTGVTLDKDEETLKKKGETVQLSVTVSPDDATNKRVVWSSSNPNVATVDETGKVTAVGKGTCTITATTEDGSFIAICTIKVEIPDSDNGGNNGDNNSGDNNQSNEDANTPANTKEDKKPNVEAPKTGDASNVTLWSLLLALSALALAGIRVARRKRSSSIEK